MSNKIEISTKVNIIKACDMADGQIGVIIEQQPEFTTREYAGKVVIKGCDGITALDNGDMWGSSCSLLVQVLPVGTKINITVGECNE